MSVFRAGVVTILLAWSADVFAGPRSFLVPKELRRTNISAARARGVSHLPGARYATPPTIPSMPQTSPVAAAAAQIDLHALLARNAVNIPKPIFSPRLQVKSLALPKPEEMPEPIAFGPVNYRSDRLQNGGGPGGGGGGDGGGGGGSPSGGGGGPQDHSGGPGELGPNGGRDLNGDRGGQRRIPHGDYFKEFPDQGNGWDIPPPGTREPHGFAPASSELIPAGANGNPAWSYRSALPGGVFEGCQATLVSTQDNVCRAATAAHCLEDALKVYGGQFNPSVGMYEGVAHITSADFKAVKVKIFLNQKYVEHRGNGGNDSALMAWPCDPSQVNVPIVPFVDNFAPLQNGQRVFYGKVMGGKEGLYTATTDIKAGTQINYVQDGVEHLKLVQPDGYEIQQGDSGGPVFVGQPGRMQLYGVLSTRENTDAPQGNYTVGPAVLPIAVAARMTGETLGFPKVIAPAQKPEEKAPAEVAEAAGPT